MVATYVFAGLGWHTTWIIRNTKSTAIEKTLRAIIQIKNGVLRWRECWDTRMVP